MTARTRWIGVSLWAAVLLLAVNADGQTASFADDTFDDSDWHITRMSVGEGGSVSAVQEETGGNPDSFRRIINHCAGTGTIYGFHMKLDAVYNPAVQGAIESLDYFEDSRMFVGFGQGQATGPALHQDGRFYFGPGMLSNQSTWTTQSRTGVAGETFVEFVNGSGHDSGSHPDFSSSGSPITFGFFRRNSNGTYTINAGIDNWSVVLSVDPGAPPACDAGGPYAPPCNGASTSVMLDGSGSFDPDDDVLTYLWESDCPNTCFDDPSSATPVLTVDTSGGCAGSCNVTLTVDDGTAISSCSTTVTVSPEPPFEISIDATALSVDSFKIVELGADSYGTSVVQTFTLAPGSYRFRYPSAAGIPQITFTVNSIGQAGYNEALEGVVTGQGTTSLTVHGRTMTIDLRSLSYAGGNLRGTSAPELSTSSVNSLTLIPGPYSVSFSTGSSVDPTVPFTLTNEGNVTYDPARENYVSGQDTSALSIDGFAVRVDADALSYASTSISAVRSVSLHVAGITPIVAADLAPVIPFDGSQIELTLARGSQRLRFLSAATTAHPSVHFSLDADGHVQFDADTYGEYVSAARTTDAVDPPEVDTLIISGHPIQIDPLALAPARNNFTIRAVGSRSTGVVHDLRLVAGRCEIDVNDSQLDFEFRVMAPNNQQGRPSGTIGYADASDPARFDQAACGLDTTTLTITLDADGDGWADCGDNCAAIANADQLDSDSDGVGDACDLCPGFDDNIDDNGNGIPDGCDNQPPTAVAGDDVSIHAGDAVFLDGSSSFDDNTASETLIYAWTMTQKPAGSSADQSLSGADTALLSFVTDVPGAYELSLVVTDEGGLSSAPDTVAVSSLNLAPSANAGVDFGAIVGDLVILDGSASSDPDNDSLTFSWSLTAAPDGSSASLDDATAVTPSFVADLPGGYTLQLVVSDGFESSAADDVVVSVITAEDFAENNTMEALNDVSALPVSDVTTPGNQNALGNFMTQAIEALQAGDNAEAISKLNKALMRTDGCVLRGEPDGNGPGRDWITDCAEQAVVYQLLQDALDAITP